MLSNLVDIVCFPILFAAGEEVVVATTRIETMLGDTGVAVNPKDTRFSVGCLCENFIVNTVEPHFLFPWLRDQLLIENQNMHVFLVVIMYLYVFLAFNW